MNKKKLSNISMCLLTVMVLTSIIGSAKALGEGLIVDTYITTPFVDPSTLTNMQVIVDSTPTYVCDGTIRINHGKIRSYDYEGPLGTGILYLENLYTKGQVAIPYSNIIETGEGVFQYYLVIDNGPYGTGILKGIGKLEWNYNLPEYIYEMWGTAKIVPVEGELNIKWVSIEVSQILFDTWWTTTTVVS